MTLPDLLLYLAYGAGFYTAADIWAPDGWWRRG